MRLPVAFLAALALSLAGRAQGFTEVGGALTVGVPQGGFAERLGDAAALGASAHLLHHAGAAPVAFGAEASYRTYGLWTDGGYSETTTTNNIVQLLGLVRLQEPTGAVQPYAEAVLGVSYLFTENGLYDPDYDSVHLLGDAALLGGLGGGVMLPVYRGGADWGGDFEVVLDLRVRYLFGGPARYFTPGDVLPDGYVVEPPRRSTTDLLAPHVGVAVRF